MFCQKNKRLAYTLFLYLPLFLCFLMPLFIIKWPFQLYFPVSFSPVITLKMGLHAFFIAALWFLLASLPLLIKTNSFKPFERRWDDGVVTKLAIMFSLLGFISIFLKTFSVALPGFQQVVHLISFMSIIAALLFYYQLKQGLCLGWKRLFFIVAIGLNLLVVVSFPLLIGQASEIACGLVAFLFGMILMRASWREILFFLMLFFAIIFLAMITKDSVRYAFGHLQSYGVKVVAKPVDIYSISSLKKISSEISNEKNILARSEKKNQLRFFCGRPNSYICYFSQKALYRLERLTQFAYVLNVVPKHYSYWDGASYQPIATALIPRVLWKDKPIDNMGVLYAHKMHYSTANNLVTSIAMPYPLEAWLNFGWPGIIISALLIGFFFRFIWDFFVSGYSAPGNLMFAVIIIYTASRGESSAYTVFGNLTQGLIFYWAIDYCIRRFGRRSNESLCTNNG